MSSSLQKTALVTGATGGLGLATALKMAQSGYKVILTGRNQKRIDNAVDYVKKNAEAADVQGIFADFMSLDDVRKLAERVNSEAQTLDVVINNAGSIFPEKTFSKDGFEATLAVNYLAPFLLTNLLMKKILASAPARIVNLASVAHYLAKFDFNDMAMEKRRYERIYAYGHSKLAVVTFTKELSRRLAGRNVIANSIHPGAVATGIWATGAPNITLILRMLMRVILTPAQGADFVTKLAFLPTGDDAVTGRYYSRGKQRPPSKITNDPEVAAELWSISEKMVGLG
jgi:NAD(P)-dependent dehydrogenase (short-subunit alcohol dehydrogenase family)